MSFSDATRREAAKFTLDDEAELLREIARREARDPVRACVLWNKAEELERRAQKSFRFLALPAAGSEWWAVIADDDEFSFRCDFAGMVPAWEALRSPSFDTPTPYHTLRDPNGIRTLRRSIRETCADYLDRMARAHGLSRPAGLAMLDLSRAFRRAEVGARHITIVPDREIICE